MTSARYLLLPLLLISLVIGGCSPLIVGDSIVQERSVRAAVDDLSIRAELNKIFFEDNIELLSNVSFSVIESRVLLKGAVEKHEHRIRALELAWQAAGVKEVINEIQVSDQDNIVDYVRDTWISTQLKTEILFDTNILSINYNIETINGAIYIVGIARNQSELDRVVDHARRIENVKKVVNHVVMRNDPRRTPTP